MTQMTLQEKQTFLAEPHVGIVSIPRPDAGPLTVPVWYDYRPGGALWFITPRHSRKGRLLDVGVRISLCAQSEALPYRYVSVEGPVIALDPLSDELLPMAVRYLGEEQGRAYAASAVPEEDVVVRVRPERWLAVDYGKRG
ncbi:MAG TPA: pyridoxamine 5'-phosphate oxidase family protein [Pseudomonadales bacterium]